MSTQTRTQVNGVHELSPEVPVGSQRFADVPRAIDIPVGDAGEAVEIDLEDLTDDPTELCTLLENENVAKGYWTAIALAYAKQSKLDVAIEIVNRGLAVLSQANPQDKLSLYNCLCWLYLLKSRQAPRVKPDNLSDPDVKTKDHYLRQATSTLNDASRISPSFPPLFLARGVLCVLRAALTQSPSEKTETLRQASKSFEDANRNAGGKNMLALLGKARSSFSLGRFPEALQCYQQVLQRAPDITDPDPRIGIGCCFWQLGHKDDAKAAWERALEVSPDSKIATTLLGLYFLDSISHLSTDDPQFATTYRKAMVQYTQKAYKIDNELPLACATFGGYFLARKAMPTVENLARKAIELTDVNAIASDGWYLLARKEHYGDELVRATEFYAKADQARGGEDRGYLPAKFGLAQLKVLQGDIADAKFRLEKIIQQTKSIEAMTLLGTLFAEDVFTPKPEISGEELTSTTKKAIALFEAVRTVWKDPKKHTSPDPAVLLNLARLYEADTPEKSLQCLQQVQQMEVDEFSNDDRPAGMDDAAWATHLRESLPPQLLNNLGCFHYQADRLSEARELFQTALNACVKLGDKDDGTDTDALVSTISFNLARTYEAEGMLDEAKKVYEGLLERHSGYAEASIRLTYIALRQSPTEEGPKAMAKLYESDSADLEVRSLYGWFLRKAKRRTPNINEDQEQRHFKHTLQNHDKHDRYALTGMGNLFIATAREMKRDSDQDRDRRTKMYTRGVEFFDKALQLDPRNAYAAQGIAIAMVEDKRDFGGALQAFSKVRETVKDASVHINLGHIYCELKQYSRAIESYEAALARDRQRDSAVLACLGRAWLLRGKHEKSTHAMKMALDYSQRALQVNPEQVHFKFNVAFVQIQIAQLLYSLADPQRTLEEVETAAIGLDEAIESFINIAKSPNPPFPRGDIEQRANMGKNTMKRQLERAIQSQREYESKNSARIQKAREQREAEIQRREEARRKVEQAEAETRARIAEERRKIAEKDRELAAQRDEEDRKRAEDDSVDEEGGEKKRRPKKQGGKRKKKNEENDSEIENGADPRSAGSSTPAGSEAERPRKKKKRRLERRGKENSKFKSTEMVESDSDPEAAPRNETSENEKPSENGDGDPAASSGPKRRVITDDDEDEGVELTSKANGEGDPITDLFDTEQE